MIIEVKKENNELIDELAHQRYEMEFEETGVDEKELKQNKDRIINEVKTFINEHLEKDLFILANITDTKIVSTASLIVHKYYSSFNNIKGEKGTLSFVYTKKEYRGKGYSYEILNKIKELALNKDISTIRVNSNNPAAINLYKKVGFIKTENNYKLNLK